MFTAAIVGTFAAGMFMSINDSEARGYYYLTQAPNDTGGGGGDIDCYSASSGNADGAWFYDCGSNVCAKVDGVHSGNAQKCSK